MAASGVPNMAVIPAAAPATSRLLRSAALRLKHCANSDPIAPPVSLEVVEGADGGPLEIRATAWFDYPYEGPPSCVHGGVIAATFDEILGAANMVAGSPGMTGTLTVRSMREGEFVRVEICDDGPGISEDIIDRIFTPFFTTKPFGEGTGLGLDLAWRIVVEKHHGNLRVESQPGDTRFIVLLPMVAPAPEAPTPTELPGE